MAADHVAEPAAAAEADLGGAERAGLMGRYKPRPLAILTIPAEHAPVPGAETVRLRFFGGVQKDRVEEADRLDVRRRIAKSHQVGFDADMEVKVTRARSSAVRAAAEDEGAEPEAPTPLQEALGNWPALHVVRVCLHSIVGEDDDPTDDPIATPESDEADREAWLRDQSAGALEWLAEQQFRASGVLRDTEAERGEG